jgi:hypothetical protein
MKLYEVPNNSYIRIIDKEIKIPVCALQLKTNDIIWFGHIDGMYSYCKDKDNNVVHLAGWTEVEIVKGENK